MPMIQMYVQLVWSTYERSRLIDHSIEDRVWSLLAARARSLGAMPVTVGGMPDHIHLVASLPATLTIARLASDLKGASSHAMTHQLAPGRPFRWQEGYGAFSLRRDDLPRLVEYIRNQRLHHQRATLWSEWEPPEFDAEPAIVTGSADELARSSRPRPGSQK